jgi:hypothetical protein
MTQFPGDNTGTTHDSGLASSNLGYRYMLRTLKNLFEQIKTYEEVQMEVEKDQERAMEQLEALEIVRKETYDRVVTDNTDNVARERLDESEQEIADLKKQSNSEQKRARQKLRALQAGILQNQDKAVEELQGSLQKKQDALAKLRTSLIPKAKARLASLQERESVMEAEVRDLRKEMRKTSKINLDNLAV